jgi:ribosomal protein S18 acetylase RimI-like enzyme
LIRFEALSKKYDRSNFTCGVPVLDGWFLTRAGQDERRNVARVFVALDERGIVGFYSLSMFTLVLEDLPPEMVRKLPMYEAVPAALIGRLARHERVRGQGVGELLLADAITRILGAVRAVAAFAMVVDAKDERAIAFYESFGFIPFPSRPRRLFLLTDTAAAGWETAVRKK